MKCWVCSRQARGFGHADMCFRIADPRRYPLDWVFCSRRCQNAFHTLYGNWIKASEEGNGRCREVVMFDATEMERAAMRLCLRAFGQAAEQIGFDKPLGAYSEAEALRVIDAIVSRYTEAMTATHEASRFPPVQGMKEAVADPMADLADDLPWETTP